MIDIVRSGINHHTSPEDAVVDDRKSGTRHSPDDSYKVRQHTNSFAIVTTKRAHPEDAKDAISSSDGVMGSSDDFTRVPPPYSAPRVKPWHHCQSTAAEHDHEEASGDLEFDGRTSHCRTQRRQQRSTSPIGNTVGHGDVGVDYQALVLKGGRSPENNEKDAGDNTGVRDDNNGTDSRVGDESICCCQLCQLCRRQDATAGLDVEDGNGSGAMQADGSLVRLAIHHPTDYALPPCQRHLAYTRGCIDTIFL